MPVREKYGILGMDLRAGFRQSDHSGEDQTQTMLFLLLAILSSTSVTLLLRFLEGRVKSEITMFTGNYAVCALLSFLYMGTFPAREEGLRFALVLGLIAGVFFLGAFLLLKKSLTVNGVALSSTFMKMGVLVPTLMAVIFFSERLTGLRLAGFLLALGAIVLLKFEKDSTGTGKRFGMLVCLLLVGGMADAFSNIYERLGTHAYADAFLLFTFLSAMLISGALAFRDRKNAVRTDILCGAALGLPNYYSSRFLLLALGRLPAVTVYPVYSVSVLVLITLGGVVFYKERLSARKWAAIGIILLALLLLNL